MVQVQEQVRNQTRNQTTHRLLMQDRKRVELTGVTEVISFDKKEIILETVEGVLRFEGEELHVKRVTLERGEVDIEGQFRGLLYQESDKDKTAGSLISRLFR